MFCYASIGISSRYNIETIVLGADSRTCKTCSDNQRSGLVQYPFDKPGLFFRNRLFALTFGNHG